MERWLSMISMNRCKMEPRPYEFLLQLNNKICMEEESAEILKAN